MDTNEVYAVLDQFKAASEALSSALRVIMGQLKDIQSENEQLKSANDRLTQDYNAMRQRSSDLDGELFSARQEARQAKSDVSSLQGTIDAMTSQINTLQAEASKLREIILTVAAATDAIVNPKAPEVALAAPKSEQAQTEVATQTYGSPFPDRF